MFCTAATGVSGRVGPIVEHRRVRIIPVREIARREGAAMPYALLDEMRAYDGSTIPLK
jgi:hypothetical protein